MKRKQLYFIVFMLLPVLAGITFAPTPAAAKAPILVTTEWLAKNLGAQNLVIIDVRTESNYGVGHLPGSVSYPYSEWEVSPDNAPYQLMPSPEDFSEAMRGLGVNTSSHVIIYDQGNTTSDATKGAASLWILKAMGHENVSYLDGGFTKWTFEGRIIDNKKPAPKPGNFVAKKDPSKVATLAQVTDNLKTKKAILVDDRAADQHFGISKRADVARYGHIPGSLSFPADYMTNAGINRAPATIKSKEKLAAMAKGIGLPADKNKQIIVYCNSAQFAAMGYLTLHEILGYKNVSVFDGSMLEYAAMDNLPLVKFAWGFVTQ